MAMIYLVHALAGVMAPYRAKFDDSAHPNKSLYISTQVADPRALLLSYPCCQSCSILNRSGGRVCGLEDSILKR